MATYPFQNEYDLDAGGYFVPEELAAEVFRLIHDVSIIPRLARNIPMKRRVLRTRGLAEGVEAYTVDSPGGEKTVDMALFEKKDIQAEKFAVIVPFEDELLDDMDTDLAGIITEDVVQAFAEKIDRCGFGCDATCPASWDEILVDLPVQNPSHIIAYGTGVDLPADISAAMGTIEVDLNRPITAFVAHPRLKQLLRDLRDSQNRPIYQELTQGGAQDTLYGYPIYYTKQLTTTDSPEELPLIAGNWPFALYGNRQTMKITKSSEATLVIGQETKNMFQRDMTAIRFVARAGFRIRNWDAFAVVDGIT